MGGYRKHREIIDLILKIGKSKVPHPEVYQTYDGDSTCSCADCGLQYSWNALVDEAESYMYWVREYTRTGMLKK